MNLNGTLILLAALAVANYRLHRSVVYPPFIFVCIWLMDLTVYRMNLIEIDKLHAVTLNVISMGAILFSAGGALAFLVPGVVLRTRFTVIGPPRGSGSRLKFLIVFLLALGVLLQFRYLAGLAASAGGGGLGMLIAARQAMIDQANATGLHIRWFTYITTWAVFSALLFHLDRRGVASRIMLVIALVSCLASTGRGQFLQLLAALSTIYLIQSNREKFKPAFRLLRWPVLAFVSLFVVLMFTNKDTSHITVTPAMYVEQSLVGYLCGSTAALNLVLRHPADFINNGLPGTLEPLFHLAGALGLISYTPPPMFENYVFVPFPINTFTLYKGWIADYGLLPAFTILTLVAFLHTLLYRKARTGSQFALYLYALSIFSVLLVFFVDTYSSLSFYAHATVFGAAYLTLRSLPAGLFKPSMRGEFESAKHLPA